MEGKMRAKILRTLGIIEELQKVKILYACSSYSEGCKHALDHKETILVQYVYLNQQTQEINFSENFWEDTIRLVFSDPSMHFTGWEVRKTLREVATSNASLLEWIQAPLIYRRNAYFYRLLKEYFNGYFCPKSVMEAYLSFAENMLEKKQNSELIEKKYYLHIIKYILKALWIGHDLSIPPNDLEQLLSLLREKPYLAGVIQQMNFQHQLNHYVCRNDAIDEFIYSGIQKGRTIVKNLPRPNYSKKPLKLFYEKLYENEWQLEHKIKSSINQKK